MMDCLFCKIIRGEIPSVKVYEDERVLVFRDIQPQAPFHALAVPKNGRHMASLNALAETPENGDTVGYLLSVVASHQEEWGLTGGYRVITNVGQDAGQTVPHLHFHILGGCTLPVTLV